MGTDTRKSKINKKDLEKFFIVLKGIIKWEEFCILNNNALLNYTNLRDKYIRLKWEQYKPIYSFNMCVKKIQTEFPYLGKSAVQRIVYSSTSKIILEVNDES